MMATRVVQDVPAPRAEPSSCFISKLHSSISKGLPHADPIFTLRTNEHELVQDVLHMLQGFPNSLFFWDKDKQGFCMKDGIYTPHLSQTSLKGILSRFIYSATCLKHVESFVRKVEGSRQRSPTLKAFANSVHSWLKRLRDVSLAVEIKSAELDTGTTVTLLELTNSLSSLCSGAEHLVRIVYGATPGSFFESETSVTASEMAVHILNHLFMKLNEICLVQGGEEEPYHMLLTLFIGSLLPYLEGLDSWLYDGILDDPYEEMFFYTNRDVAIDQPAFWERSYLLRIGKRKLRSGVSLLPSGESTVQVKRVGDQESIPILSSAKGKDQNDVDILLCPVFLKDIARAIVSAGKSLQLVQHVQDDYAASVDRSNDYTPYNFGEGNLSTSGCESINQRLQVKVRSRSFSPPKSNDGHPKFGISNEEIRTHIDHSRVMNVLTLSDIFLISLVGLIGDGCHIYEYFKMYPPAISHILDAFMDKNQVKETGVDVPTPVSYDSIWFTYLADAILKRRDIGNINDLFVECVNRDSESVDMKKMEGIAECLNPKWQDSSTVNMLETTLISSCPRNPAMTVCRESLEKNIGSWNELNISRNFHLPPLNDENMREAIFDINYSITSNSTDLLNNKTAPGFSGTDYTFGFQFNELERLRVEDSTKTLETLYPFPTILPSTQEDATMSEFLPFQKNSTLASKILCWLHSIKLMETPQPAIIIQECLAFYIRKQVDHVGKHILLKLMRDWKLMDELGVLHAVYLLGSGDLLQHFLIVMFNKLDKGDYWDDDFELNTILQESIRNSADGALLSAPDSLVVSITTQHSSDDEANTADNVTTPRKVQKHFLGIDVLDLMTFTYKVSWPLDLIANMEALKKYNQVMGFLLKVKRAKFALDKARRWMWKSKGSTTYNYKHHLLVEQKLLHFVDAFHQYVMDRVFHSAWVELCKGMASASSLDEVIEVHEAYLLSIQRQCFVAPDKLWALIASRIKSILGLALDFYSIQQTLSSGGAAPAIKARCEMEVDRIEKQFDDCIAFLLRILSFKLNVGHFPHLADLVTRINYNYFYMSSSGNLQTIPSFETTAKLGKSSAFRAD